LVEQTCCKKGMKKNQNLMLGQEDEEFVGRERKKV